MGGGPVDQVAQRFLARPSRTLEALSTRVLVSYHGDCQHSSQTRGRLAQRRRGDALVDRGRIGVRLGSYRRLCDHLAIARVLDSELAQDDGGRRSLHAQEPQKQVAAIDRFVLQRGALVGGIRQGSPAIGAERQVHGSRNAFGGRWRTLCDSRAQALRAGRQLCPENRVLA